MTCEKVASHKKRVRTIVLIIGLIAYVVIYIYAMRGVRFYMEIGLLLFTIGYSIYRRSVFHLLSAFLVLWLGLVMFTDVVHVFERVRFDAFDHVYSC